MNLGHKLRKLITGDALSSAARHVRPRNLWRPLDRETARILATVPTEEFEKIRRRHAVPEPGDAWPKYLELERWLAVNLQRVRELDLDSGPRKRVLDLGCGTGYFLYICRYFGHDILGLDIDEEPGFAEVLALLSVPRTTWRIEAFEPLPDLGAKFDVITAHMICFNGHKSPQLWGPREWEFFLDDLGRHLQPDGRIMLSLNREIDGTNFTPKLKEYFISRGAKIHTQRVVFAPLRPGRAEEPAKNFRPALSTHPGPHSA